MRDFIAEIALAVMVVGVAQGCHGTGGGAAEEDGGGGGGGGGGERDAIYDLGGDGFVEDWAVGDAMEGSVVSIDGSRVEDATLVSDVGPSDGGLVDDGVDRSEFVESAFRDVPSLDGGMDASSAVPDAGFDVLIPARTSAAQHISGDVSNGCVSLVDGTVWCWGEAAECVLGGYQLTPVPIPMLDHVQRPVVGAGSACVIRNDASVACWEGYEGMTSLPMDIDSPSSSVQSLAIGDGWGIYALLPDGSIWGWGVGAMPSPTHALLFPSGTATAIAVERGGLCVITPMATVECTGFPEADDFGTLTLGSFSGLSAPVPGFTDVVQIAGGLLFQCMLRMDGTVWCVGDDSAGELGTPAREICFDSVEGLQYYCSSVPLQVSGLTGVVQLAAGPGSACALRNDGTVWCWGGDTNGDIGDGLPAEAATCPQPDGPPVGGCRPTPVQVVGLGPVTEISIVDVACALLRDDSIWCWGLDGNYPLTELLPPRS